MARRAGCCAGCALLVVLAGFSTLVWLSLNAFGLVSSSGVTKALTAAALGLCVLAAVGIGITLRRVAPPVSDLIRAARESRTAITRRGSRSAALERCARSPVPSTR